MRQMSLGEVAQVHLTGKCPFCKNLLTPGPRGGMSINVLCQCGAKFNVMGVCYIELRDDDPIPFGQVIEEP